MNKENIELQNTWLHDFSSRSCSKIKPSFDYDDEHVRERTITESMNELISSILRIRDKLWIENPDQHELISSEAGSVLYDINLRLDKSIVLVNTIYKELNQL